MSNWFTLTAKNLALCLDGKVHFNSDGTATIETDSSPEIYLELVDDGETILSTCANYPDVKIYKLDMTKIAQEILEKTEAAARRQGEEIKAENRANRAHLN